MGTPTANGWFYKWAYEEYGIESVTAENVMKDDADTLLGGYLSTGTVGDLLYHNAAASLAKINAVAVGSVLASAGTGTAPLWTTEPMVSKIGVNVAVGATSATADVAGVIRGKSVTPTYPTAGKGIEIYYDADGDKAYVQAYDRGGTIHKPLYLVGSDVVLDPYGAGKIYFGSNSAYDGDVDYFGFGTVDPVARVQVTCVAGTSFPAQFTTADYATNTGSALLVEFGANTGDTYSKISAKTGGGTTVGNLVLQAGGGNISIGTASALGTSADRVLAIGGSTAPSSAPADMIQLWAADWGAGDARAYLLSEAGARMVLGNNCIMGLGYIYGSEASGGHLKCRSTYHASKGNIYFGEANTHMFDEVNSTWGFGITAVSTIKLYAKADTADNSKYALSLVDINSADLLYVRNDGVGYLKAASWSYGSDENIKENVEYLTGTGLATIMALKPASFDYIDGAKDNFGFVAQDVQNVIPKAVTTEKDGNLGLKLGFITPFLVMAIQEQQAQIEALQAALAVK